jgi:hypothetical protein
MSVLHDDYTIAAAPSGWRSLYEPLHDVIRAWPWFARGAIYMIGFFVIEYLTGCPVKRRSVGVPPQVRLEPLKKEARFHYVC